jgi:hypothetical protein
VQIRHARPLRLDDRICYNHKSLRNMFQTRCRRGFGVLVLAGSLVAPVAVLAQNPPLGEIARKEQERRKALQGKGQDKGKVITNKDLPPSAHKPAAAQPAPAAGDQKPADETTPAGQPPAGGEEKDETWWRGRMTQARESLRRSEMFLEALQSRINALSADFVARDDPAQRARIAEDRQKALAELDRVQTDIVEQRKQIEDIEEEARKAGVPPGWLR